MANLDLGQFGTRPLVNSDPVKKEVRKYSELANVFLKIGSELAEVRIDLRSELTIV